MLPLGLAAVLFSVVECKAPSQTQADHGRDLYGRICSVCHGPNGEGYKADAAPALAQPDFLMSVSDAHLRRAIERGRPGTTMSAWAKEKGGPLEPSDVDAVIAFLRTWQKGPRASLDESPLVGEPARGLVVWQAQCTQCHGLTGTGGQYTNLANPELLASATDGYLRYAIRNGRTGTPMPSFQNLGPNGIDDLVALLRAWQSPAPDSGSPQLAITPPAYPTPLALGKVLAHPNGPEPAGFKPYPQTVGCDVVKAQLDRGARLGLLDARAPSDYTNEHIAGAVSVPFYDPDPYLEKLPKDAWLICYCACPHAESGQLASKLQAKGFTKVTVLEEGINVWKNKKYGVNKGAQP